MIPRTDALLVLARALAAEHGRTNLTDGDRAKAQALYRQLTAEPARCHIDWTPLHAVPGLEDR